MSSITISTDGVNDDKSDLVGDFLGKVASYLAADDEGTC